METQKKAVYLIRHAQSEFNAAEILVGLDVVDFDKNYADPILTKLGQQQAEVGAEFVKDKNIKYVISSPMKRTIQTASIIFKDHTSKPKFLVHPLFREHIHYSCDVASPVDILEETFSDLELDWTLMKNFEDRDLWHITDFFDETTRNELLEEIKKKAQTPEEIRKIVGEVMMEKSKGQHPKPLESYDVLAKRIEKAKEELKQLVREVGPDESIAIVAHWAFLRYFTSTRFGEKLNPLDGYDFRNCEVLEYIVEY